MKKYTLILLLIIEVFFSYADAYKMKLHEIIRISDYCFLGEIIQITGQKYFFRIDSSFFLQSNDSIIEVEISPYDCGHKISKRVLGEKIILFLTKSNSFGYPFEYDNQLFLLKENEFPINNDTISYTSCDKIRFASLNDFINTIIECKKNYSDIKKHFDHTFYEFKIAKKNRIDLIDDILIDTFINNFYIKSDIFKSILCDLTYIYNLKLSISLIRFKPDIISTKIYPFLIKNNDNFFQINEEYGIFSDSLSFKSQELTIIRKNNIIIIKPDSYKKSTLYIIHHFKNFSDTIQIIEFKIVRSAPLLIDLKTNVLYIQKGFNRYALLIQDNSGIIYNEYNLLSCVVKITTENEIFTYHLYSPMLKNDLKEKIKTMKENDIIELIDIYAVDAYGNCIEIKPIKYKLKKIDKNHFPF
jgi:hypothetical protein